KICPLPTIHLTTFIQAPKDIVFDYSRNIDLHKKSMAHTNEEAVAGTTMGLINLGETVTWKARHVGKTRYFRSKIVSMKSPESFTDEMIEGDFKSFKHDHFFKSVANGTLMIDYLHYQTPYGFLGRIVDRLYLRRYLTGMLETRNNALKKF